MDVRVAVTPDATGEAPRRLPLNSVCAWGAIFALVAVAGFALAGGAFAIAESTGPVRFGSEMAARLTGVTIMHHRADRAGVGASCTLRRTAAEEVRPSARLMTLGLAVGNMILFPFGTALGAYAFWVLLKDEGRGCSSPDIRSGTRSGRVTISFRAQRSKGCRFCCSVCTCVVTLAAS